VPAGRVEEFLAVPRLSQLVTRASSGMVATTLPLIYERADDGPGTFLGHLARANPQWSDLIDDEALVIVAGPDAYVSPASYATRRRTGRVVPTWNYVSVQGHGRLVVHDEPDWIERLVRTLTDAAERGRADRWSVDEAPSPFLAGQLQGIIGVEVVLDRLEGKWKLSQNRTEDDRDGVARDLAVGTPREREVAAEMRRLLEEGEPS
jgi:transcriptional regulator